MSLIGRREFEDIRPASSGLRNPYERRIRRKQNQVLDTRKYTAINLAHEPTSSTSLVDRFFHRKCKRPSSPFCRMIAPFVGLGSTELDPSRLNARPALKASRSVIIGISSRVLRSTRRVCKAWEHSLIRAQTGAHP
jgi:hypothetical protein